MFRLVLRGLLLLYLWIQLVEGEALELNIVLTPRDWKDPRAEDVFLCGIDTALDPGRLIAEQNPNYIFDFLDKTKDEDPRYQTNVFNVMAFDKNDQPHQLQDKKNGESPGLYTLFLAPPGRQCNRLTFEDAEEEGEGYYPVFVGTSDNFREAIQWFTSEASKFKAHYTGRHPKLCGTELIMKNGTANSRRKELNSLFNFIANTKPRKFDPTKWKSCWTREETLQTIGKSAVFDTTATVEFKHKDQIAKEEEGFAIIEMVRKTELSKKTVAFVESDFSLSKDGCSQASEKDVVPVSNAIVFDKGETEGDFYMRLKYDAQKDKDKCLHLRTVNTTKNRRKRTTSPRNAVQLPVTVRDACPRNSKCFRFEKGEKWKIDKEKCPWFSKLYKMGIWEHFKVSFDKKGGLFECQDEEKMPGRCCPAEKVDTDYTAQIRSEAIPAECYYNKDIDVIDVITIHSQCNFNPSTNWGTPGKCMIPDNPDAEEGLTSCALQPVDCVTNEHCTGPTKAKCNENMKCVQCEVDKDCERANGFVGCRIKPFCKPGTQTNVCVGCKKNSDCEADEKCTDEGDCGLEVKCTGLSTNKYPRELATKVTWTPPGPNPVSYGPVVCHFHLADGEATTWKCWRENAAKPAGAFNFDKALPADRNGEILKGLVIVCKNAVQKSQFSWDYIVPKNKLPFFAQGQENKVSGYISKRKYVPMHAFLTTQTPYPFL